MKKTKLYTFKYYNQYMKKETTCEFRGVSEKEAKKLAIERITEVDKKWINKEYLLKDFILESVDDTFLEEGKIYKTRSGKKVEIINLKRNTTSSFKVEGYIIEKPKSGKIKRIWTIWDENGRYTVGKTNNDLVEVI